MRCKNKFHVGYLEKCVLGERPEGGHDALVVALGAAGHGGGVREEGVAAPVLAELLSAPGILALQDVLQGILEQAVECVVLKCMKRIG